MATSNTTLDRIHAEMQNLIPTPPVGTPVQWFELNEDDRCYAAVITRIEGPGKVAVKISKPSAVPTHRQGVLHRSSPVLKNRHATETMRNGAWDYLPDYFPGNKIPTTHFKKHLNELKRREEGILEQERLVAEAAARAAAAAGTT